VTLYTLRKAAPSVPPSWDLADPRGAALLHVDSHAPLPGGGPGRPAGRLDISSRNAAGDGRAVRLSVEGDLLGRGANLKCEGRTVARVRRGFVGARDRGARAPAHVPGRGRAPGRTSRW